MHGAVAMGQLRPHAAPRPGALGVDLEHRHVPDQRHRTGTVTARLSNQAPHPTPRPTINGPQWPWPNGCRRPHLNRGTNSSHVQEQRGIVGHVLHAKLKSARRDATRHDQRRDATRQHEKVCGGGGGTYVAEHFAHQLAPLVVRKVDAHDKVSRPAGLSAQRPLHAIPTSALVRDHHQLEGIRCTNRTDSDKERPGRDADDDDDDDEEKKLSKRPSMRSVFAWASLMSVGVVKMFPRKGGRQEVTRWEVLTSKARAWA